MLSMTPEAARLQFDDLYDGLRNPLMHGSDFVDDTLEGLRAFAKRISTVASLTEHLVTRLE